MSFFAKCKACNKRKLHIQKRVVLIPIVNTKATSQNELCRKCWKDILRKTKTRIDWETRVEIWRIVTMYYIYEATRNNTLSIEKIEWKFPYFYFKGSEYLKP